MAAGPTRPVRSRRWRTFGRWTCLAVALALAWPLRPDAWSATSVVLPALSPFVALGGALAARTAGLLALLALPVIVIVWLWPRALCRYVCPVGLLQETLARLRPCARRPWLRLPLVGRWLAVATLVGAGFGYPVFLWLDPFALFHGSLNAWRLPLTGASLAAGLGLLLLLLLELAWPQLWCRRLCPLGATQDLISRLRSRLRFRPTGGATPAGPAPRPLACSRRTFFATCAGAASAVALPRLRAQPPPLRPPGALEEDRFTGTCIRCGNCVQACPSHIIQPDLRGGLTGLLAPRLNFAADFCREDCHRCQLVCPSGAIAHLTLPEKRRAVIGSARVDLDTCLMALGRECNACVQSCPYDAIAVAAGSDGFSSQPRVNLAACNGCGACEAACPALPARAIVVLARM
jgi:ferredoxin